MDVNTLKQIGGSEWMKNGMHRVYFNDLPALYGLSCEHYGTGNISSAKLNGEGISNSHARKLISALSGKFWYDVTSGTFQGQYLSKEIVATLAENVRRFAETGKNPSVVAVA